MIIDGNEYIETIKRLMEMGNSVNVITYSLYGEIEELFELFKKTNSKLIISIPPYMPCNDDGCKDCFNNYIDKLESIFDILDENEINAKALIKVHAKMFYSKMEDGSYIYSLGSKNLYSSQSLDLSFVNISNKNDEDLKYLMNAFEVEWEREQLMPFGKYMGEKISEIIKDDSYINSLYGIGLGKITTSSMPLFMFLALRNKNGEKLYL